MDKVSELVIDIIDHPHVSVWMEELQKNDRHGYHRLIGDNVNRFTKLYGKPNKLNTTDEWSARWDRNFNKLDWIILSTDKQGTIYRIKTALTAEEFTSDSRIGIGIIDYLTELCEVLMGKYNY